MEQIMGYNEVCRTQTASVCESLFKKYFDDQDFETKQKTAKQ